MPPGQGQYYSYDMLLLCSITLSYMVLFIL